MGQYFVRASDYPLGTRLSSLGFHSVNGEDAEVIETDLLGKAFAVVGEGSGTARDLTLPSSVIDTTLPYRFHAVTQRAALTNPAGYFVAFDSPNNYFRLGRRNRQLVIERLQNGSFSALASGGNDNDRNDEKQLWSAYIDANQQSISTEFLSGIADPDSLTVNTSNAFLLVSEPGLLFRSGPEEAYDFFEIGIGTNGDPAPTGPVDPGGTDDLTANDISGTSQVSAPTIGQAHALTANDASSVSSITLPAISQAHDLTSTDVSSASTTSSAAIGQTHSLTAPVLQSSSQVSSPSLAVQENTDSLTANDISSASSVAPPSLGQVHNIAANDVASASETGTPTLRQEHALASVSLESLSTVSSPTLTSIAGQTGLSANDVEATSTTSTPALGQVHVLQSATVDSDSRTSQPGIGQVHTLTANDLAATSSVSTPIIRDASQTLATPIRNTKATVRQTAYKAAIIQTVYKAEAS